MDRVERAGGFAGPLLDWFQRNRRPLPWRIDRDPYRIWVAEVLLQQTRVSQATPYYERFVARFPDVRALANAPLPEVLKLWEGAGYYARARNLHAAARHVVRDHGGRLPTSTAELRRLPGIGPYIAAAVASLAFGEAVPAFDANARRVVARWSAFEGDAKRPDAVRRLTAALAQEIPSDHPGEFNEAVMELGELLCQPHRPRCPACPVRSLCGAFQSGEDPARFPASVPRRARPHHRAAVVVLERNGRWLVQRRPERGLLGGLWEFPGGHIEPGERPEAAARRELREETGLSAGPLAPIGVVHHAYSHFTVELHVFVGAPRAGPARASATPGPRWVSPEELEALPRPMATRRIVALLRAGRREGAFPGSGSPRGRGSPSPPATARGRGRRAGPGGDRVSSRRSRARR